MNLAFAAVLLLVEAVASSEPSEARRREPGFFFAHSKTLLAGRNETVCLVLQDFVVPTRALIDLKIKERHHAITKIMHSDHSCFELPVPRHDSTEVLTASLHLQLLLNGAVHTAHNQEAILIYPDTEVTFLETDRGVYKQGDKVKVRVLVLGQDLKPNSRKNSVTHLKMVNPHGFTVAVWENVSTELGLAQLEYQLTDETVLGKWRMESNGVLKYFHVKRYILPRFKVEISAPKSVYVNAKFVEITVCAKYSFDRYVKGIVLIKISYQHIYNSSITRILRILDECATFHLNNDDLRLSSITDTDDQLQHTMSVVATVTEEGTNQIETETTVVQVKSRPYDIRFSEENPYFQPGLPYRGRLRLTDVNVDIREEVVQVCYQMAVKKTWNIKPEECSEFLVDDEGGVAFHVLPVKDNVVEIKLTAKSLNRTVEHIETTLVLKKWYSLGGSYIHIERNIRSLSKCKSPQQYTVYYTTNKLKPSENITFYYMVKTRSSILQMRKIHHTPRKQVINFRDELNGIVGKDNRFLKNENFVDRFILKFKLHNSIMSKSQLFVFYFTRDETVSSSIDIYVEKCLMNLVETSWNHPTLHPGEYATLKINTTPNSLCAVSAVDKASTFLSSHKTLNVHSLLHPLLQPRETKSGSKLNCLTNQKKKLESQYLEQFGDLRRKRSYGIILTSKDYDSYEIFNEHGLAAITNLRMISKPCPVEDKIGSLDARQLSITSTMYEVLTEDRGVSIRSYFPETWLWELVPTGTSGQALVSRYLPHSLTTWVTNTMCVSPIEGVGVSQKQEVTVFQPFFVDILTPYSIKRFEILHLQVTVFNYLNYSLPIRIVLGDNAGLELVDRKDNRRMSACVRSNDKYVHTYRVKGVVLGSVNATVLAEIESSYPSECGPETIVNKRDVVYKNILVEPEGHLSEFSKSSLLCGEEVNKVKWNIDVPKERIADSETITLTFNSDLMGPTIQNLEKFIDMPTGCGEQVMATMAPNLYVLRYLKANGKLTPNLRQRAIKNIKIGYQRILDYIHKDGSFSAFGYHDPAGSMFLTSFVVRTLQQAKDHTYVDTKVIRKATEWIMDHQLENGCFAAVSHVFQDMGGTSTENSTAALTAYVIISLMESNIDLPDGVKTNAKYCIRGQHNPDKYTLAISTYALYLLEWQSEADRYLERLLEIATKEGKLMWWSNPAGSPSVNIEMTGYVLISLLYRYTSENLVHSGAVVRWLGTQRGSHGGFITTQDTVVALDAIARYSSLIKNKDPDLMLHVSADKQKYEVAVNKNDKLKSKEVKLKIIPSNLEISATGQGCVLAQLSVTYNLRQMVNSEAFMLAVDVQPVSTIDKCSVAVVLPCVSYKNLGHSNMAVLEVSMPSGYEPDRASLYKLTEEEGTKVKRFEEYKNRVVLYFTELNNEPICVPFRINENAIIEDQVEAVVKLYDYYNPEMKVFATYKLNKCQPNVIALIPSLTESNSTKESKQSVVNDSREEEKVPVTKRDLKISTKPKYGFNSDFVNLDVDMATPSGMEGNMPMYIKPNITTAP